MNENRFLVVDDEPLARRRLLQLAAQVGRQLLGRSKPIQSPCSRLVPIPEMSFPKIQ